MVAQCSLLKLYLNYQRPKVRNTRLLTYRAVFGNVRLLTYPTIFAFPPTFAVSAVSSGQVCRKGGDNDNLHSRKVADWDRHFSCNQISWGVHCTASELLRPILRGHIGNVFLSIRVVDDWEWYISWDDNLWTAINWLHSVLQCWKQITRSPYISKQ